MSCSNGKEKEDWGLVQRKHGEILIILRRSKTTDSRPDVTGA